jgi:hypothetical protein
MYVKSLYHYFHDFRKPVRNAAPKSKRVIENGRSLKLRQMRQGDAIVFALSSLNHHQTRGPLGYTQPIHGSLEGKYELREKDGKGWRGDGGMGRVSVPR